MGARFLLDEHISPRVAERATVAGVEVVSVARAGLPGRDCRAIFEAAIDDQRILVTYSILNYSALYADLLKEGRRIPGLVLVDVDTISTSDLQGLTNAVVALAEKIERGEVNPAGGVFLRGEVS